MSKEDVIRETVFYSLQPLIDALTTPEIMGDESTKEPLIGTSFYAVCIHCKALECPKDLEKYVEEYWSRHEGNIMTILRYE